MTLTEATVHINYLIEKDKKQNGKLDRIEKDISNIKQDMNEIKIQIKADTDEIKSDLRDLKTHIFTKEETKKETYEQLKCSQKDWRDKIAWVFVVLLGCITIAQVFGLL